MPKKPHHNKKYAENYTPWNGRDREWSRTGFPGGAPVRRERKAALTAWIQEAESDPSKFDDLLDEVVEGAMLWKACHARGLDYRGMQDWIAASPEREEALRRAEDTSKAIKSQLLEQFGQTWTELDPGRAFDDEGNYLPIREMPPEVRAAIQQIRTETIIDANGKKRTVIKEIRFVDKARMSELRSRWLGMSRSATEEQGESFATAMMRAIQERRAAMAAEAPPILPEGDRRS